jgi:hypothetical protein
MVAPVRRRSWRVHPLVPLDPCNAFVSRSQLPAAHRWTWRRSGAFGAEGLRLPVSSADSQDRSRSIACRDRGTTTRLAVLRLQDGQVGLPCSHRASGPARFPAGGSVSAA